MKAKNSVNVGEEGRSICKHHRNCHLLWEDRDSWQGRGREERNMSKNLLGLKGLENYLEQRDIVGYASICSLHLERANY